MGHGIDQRAGVGGGRAAYGRDVETVTEGTRERAGWRLTAGKGPAARVKGGREIRPRGKSHCCSAKCARDLALSSRGSRPVRAKDPGNGR